jgi:hypothetical protein
LETANAELKSRMASIENSHGNLATREDLARLAGKVDMAAHDASAAVKGIDRIETILLRERTGT